VLQAQLVMIMSQTFYRLNEDGEEKGSGGKAADAKAADSSPPEGKSAQGAKAEAETKESKGEPDAKAGDESKVGASFLGLHN
jgi:hypothetical protein